MKNDKRIYVDIHALHTLPPSCVNRDDTGSPKTAMYGGALRARVSSQCWKHAMRMDFPDIFKHDDIGFRTKKIVTLLSDEIARNGFGGDAVKEATDILKTAGLNIKSADKGTDALFFISAAQVKALAAFAGQKLDKKVLQNTLRSEPGIDIAMFGRMVADDPSLNTDACAQVAHAISTHRIVNEYDYFTAVDDMSPEDNAGAAHIGSVEYNSATLYRYATIAVHQLYRALGNDTANAASGFVKAFVQAMPTGKQNTFANRTLPDALLVTIREDQPVNLAGAFEKPVQAGDDGFVAASARRLIAHASTVYADFAGAPARSLVTGALLGDMGEAMPLSELLSTLESDIDARLDAFRETV